MSGPDYDEDHVRSLVDAVLAADPADLRPGFYAVVGSHCHGFADADSDVDVRGMHLADGTRYMLLDEPAERLVVNQGTPTHGFEEWAGVDCTSHECKAWVAALATTNFDPVETLLCGEVVVNELPDEIDALRAIVRDALPLELPHSYYGLAKRTYERHLVPGQEGYDPTPKRYLYALRPLLGAHYVVEGEDVLADVSALSRAVLGDDDLVSELVVRKRAGESLDDHLAARADRQVEGLFETLTFTDASSTQFHRDLDDWLRRVRGI
ncbi:DNA polymerase beta superfamily protein [Haloarchaeobius sp. DFWS5]|uniref:DNA polymerase beta superfamily protein n=1 Tax=Haloarchaeobius sp. DFWS5 TaxID=3446114 RepID=UPI003EBDF7E3